MMQCLLHPAFILGLFCLQPVVNSWISNISDTESTFGRSCLHFLILYALSFALFKGIQLFCNRLKPHALSLNIGLMVFMTFNLFEIEAWAQSVISSQATVFCIFVCICLIALSMYFSYWVSSDRVRILPFAFFVSLLMISDLTLALVSVGNKKAFEGLIENKNTMILTERPNVYMIIPDMFIGPESYHLMTGKDLWLPEALSQKEFKVISKAYANAPSTRFSLAQIFNMDYLLADKEVMGIKGYRQLARVYFQGDNPVVKAFKSRGYKYIRIADGYVSSCDGHEDICIKKTSLYNTQDAMFLERAKILTALSRLEWMKGKVLKPGGLEPFEFMPYFPNPKEGPFFLLVHFSMPHPPVRYNETCEYFGESSQAYRRLNDRSQSRSDGITFKTLEPQIQCAQVVLNQMVENIIEKDPTAWVIVQADHGTHTNHQGTTAFSMFTRLQFDESYNILSAYRLPERCQHDLSISYSPVNTFRYVFSCLDKSPQVYLPHKSFVCHFNESKWKHFRRFEINEWTDWSS